MCVLGGGKEMWGILGIHKLAEVEIFMYLEDLAIGRVGENP